MSDTYKWGAWYPIETAPKDGTAVTLWAADLRPSGGTVVGQYIDHHIEWWHVDDGKHGPFPLRGPAPTHWMPLPPSPEEMAAARSLPDYRAPEHRGLHASALPSVKWNLAPEEMAARPSLEEILRKKMREAEEDKLPQVKNYLSQILKEAGLE